MADVDKLENFVNAVTTGITQGIPEGFRLKGDIDIELVVVSSKEVGGKFSIMIAEAGGKYEKEELSRIKFTIAKKDTGNSFLVTNDY
jgi:hypothetical protein